MKKEKGRAKPVQLALELQPPATATISNISGSIYVQYPSEVVGEQVPCVFCSKAIAESSGRPGGRTSTIYQCTAAGADQIYDMFTSPPPTCPREFGGKRDGIVGGSGQ